MSEIRKGKAFFKKLEYNCFTIMCQFLLYNKVNQLYVYRYPPLLHFPSTPAPSHPSWSSQSSKLSLLCHAAASCQPAISYTRQCMLVHSVHSFHLLLPLMGPHVCSLCVSREQLLIDPNMHTVYIKKSQVSQKIQTGTENNHFYIVFS